MNSLSSFTDMASFVDMGGYGVFVWPSFGLSAILLTGVLVFSMHSLKANRRALDALTGEGETAAAPEGPSSGET